MFITRLLLLFASQAVSAEQGGVEQALRAIANGSRSALDLRVTYDDMHGLWGGTTITVIGEGTCRRIQRLRGATTSQVECGTINAGQVQALVRLIVDLQAWEQQIAARPPVPDESRAILSIEIGDASVRIWEWYNDLAQNGRLIRIRDQMLLYSSAPNG